MSWLFSQALVAEYSAVKCSDGELCAPWSSTPTPPAFLWRDRTTEAWNRFPCGMMCEPLMESHGEDLLVWYRGDFLAKTCPEQRPMTAEGSLPQMGWMARGRASGGKCLESFARWDRASSSWKMSQLCLMMEWDSFSETWPEWGMLRDGECFKLPALVPRITVPGYFWLLTPSASDGRKRYSFRSSSLADRFRKHPNGNLAEQVSYLAQERGVMDGRLSPQFWDWMIGWPPGWTDLLPLETPKFQAWLREHGRRSRNEPVLGAV